MCQCPVCEKIFPFTFVDDEPGYCLAQVNLTGPTNMICGVINCKSRHKESSVKIDEEKKRLHMGKEK